MPEAQPRAPSPATETAPFEVFCSRHFTGWLADERLSLAFTTYQAGKLFLIGLNPAGRVLADVTRFPGACASRSVTYRLNGRSVSPCMIA